MHAAFRPEVSTRISAEALKIRRRGRGNELIALSSNAERLGIRSRIQFRLATRMNRPSIARRPTTRKNTFQKLSGCLPAITPVKPLITT